MATEATYNGVTLPVLGKPEIVFADEVLTITFETHLSADGLESARDSLRTKDQALTFTVGELAQTFSLTTNATGILLKVAKLGHRIDSDAHKRLSVTCEVEMQTTFADGFKSWQAMILENEQGRTSLRIVGEVTGKVAATAKATFEAGIGAIDTAVQAIAGGSQYDQPSDIVTIDRNNSKATFERQRVEMLEASTTSAGYDSAIVLPTWNVTKEEQTRRGTPNGSPHSPLTRFRVSWQAMFATGESASSAISKMEGTIRQLVMSRIRSQFSGASGTMVVTESGIQYSNTEKSANSTWTVEVGSDTIRFEETIGGEHLEHEAENNLDGVDYSESVYSAGTVTRITQEVTHVARDVVPAFPSAPAIAGGPTTAKGKPIKNKAYSLVRLRHSHMRSSEVVGVDGASDGYSRTVEEHTLVYSAEYALVTIDKAKKPSSDGWDNKSAFSGR